MPHDLTLEKHSCSQTKRLTREKEVELARRVAEGDDSAWGELQSAFSLVITGFFAARESQEEAESLANLSMWRGYRLVRKNKYNTKYRFYTFLRMVANGILSEHRKALAKAQTLNPSTVTFSDLVSHITQGDSDVPYEEVINVFIEPVLPPAEDRMDVIRELLELVFLCCAKPHQIIAFGFVKLLGWKPREVITDLIDQKKIGELGERLCEDYYREAEVFSSIDNFKGIVFTRFFEKLDKLFSQIYREKEYAKLAEYRNEIIRDIPYDLFFTERSRSASISDWCKKVANRTKYLVENGEPCEDDKL